MRRIMRRIDMTLIILWIAGVSCFTFLGSLYARRYGRPDLLIGLYVAFVLTAQLLAAKISLFNLGLLGVYTAPSGVLVIAVTFLLTDIVNECFGRKETQQMIFIALLAQVAMVFFLWLGAQFTPNPDAALRDAEWNAIFSAVPRITLAGWIAFFVSENLDAYIFAYFKRLTNGKRLWMRNVISTIPSLAADSALFIVIAFSGVFSASVLFTMIVGQLAIKWLVGLVNIPFMYANYAIVTRGKKTPDRVVWNSRDIIPE